MFSAEDSYKNDSTFRHIVDLMRAELGYYNITPAELRQAAMLTASMHEAEHIKPLLISKSKSWLYGGMYYSNIFVDEAKNIPPAMFGGGGLYGATTSRFSSTKTNQSNTPKPDLNNEPIYDCICAAKRSQCELDSLPHSETCKHYNWSVTHPTKPLTEHVFGNWIKFPGGDDYRVCTRCGFSNVYINSCKEAPICKLR